MGLLANGRKIDESPVRVRYTFEQLPDDPEGGVVALHADASEEGWSLRDADGGSGDLPWCAVAVAVKALRTFRRTGVWPEVVVYAA